MRKALTTTSRDVDLDLARQIAVEAAEAALTLPAASVAFAVKLWLASVSAAVVNVQLNACARAVPSAAFTVWSSDATYVVPPASGLVGVSVAVRDVDGTVAGAVYDPNRAELFAATRGGPAMLSGPEGTVELKGRARTPASGSRGADGPASPGGENLPAAMIATGLAYDADVRQAQARVLARLIPRVRDIRRFGSAALDLAWTAAGRYDAYFERSVKQWDIAAGALICERAGLRVLELPALENLPWGVLVARPGLADPLLDLVSGP